MSISLQKGQKVSLSKGGSNGLKKLVLGLGWDEVPRKAGGLFAPKPKPIDCDASVLMLQNGKLMGKSDIVYFGNLRHNSTSITHLGDNLTGAGDGDDEQIIVELDKVPANYDRIIVVVNIYQALARKQHFGMIKNAFVRIVDATNNQEIYKYDLTEDYSDMTAMIFGEVYLHNGEWKFTAMGQGTKDDSLGKLAERYA